MHPMLPMIFSIMSIIIISILMEMMLVVDINIVFTTGITVSLSFIMSNSSMMFFITVMFISVMVFLYSYYYMFEDYKKHFFYLTTIAFVMSMLVLILSNNFMSLFLGWDMLGLTSLFLVMHYTSKITTNNGMLTFSCNRMGDTIIICSSITVMMAGMKFMAMAISSLLLLSALTKSAQVPFSSWLPAAMSAPTPISSLVHSSTLVTAGVYLIIQMSTYHLHNNLINFVIFMALTTYVVSSIISIMECDMKKIIALSTLNQMSFMVLMSSMNLSMETLVYMIAHAFIKSSMFMSAGVMIHSSISYQDVRKMSFMVNNSSLMVLPSYFLAISFMGLQGMVGSMIFSAKHDLFNNMSSNMLMYMMSSILVKMFVVFTMFYTSRLMCMMIFGKPMAWTSKMSMLSSSHTPPLFILSFSFILVVIVMEMKYLNLYLLTFFYSSHMDIMMFTMILIIILSQMYFKETLFNGKYLNSLKNLYAMSLLFYLYLQMLRIIMIKMSQKFNDSECIISNLGSLLIL